MIRVLLCALLALLPACSRAPRSPVTEYPPLDPPLNHFSLLIGIARLAQERPLPPEQARIIRGRLERLQENSDELRRLDRRLALTLTEPQRAFLAGHRERPDPADFFRDLERSLSLLEERAGTSAFPPVPPLGGAAPDPDEEEVMDCVLVAYGLPLMEGRAELAVTPGQAARLGPLLAKVRQLAWEDEQSIRAIYRALDPERRQLLRRKAPEWVGRRTVHDLEEQFEALLEEASRSLREAAGY